MEPRQRRQRLLLLFFRKEGLPTLPRTVALRRTVAGRHVRFVASAAMGRVRDEMTERRVLDETSMTEKSLPA